MGVEGHKKHIKRFLWENTPNIFHLCLKIFFFPTCSCKIKSRYVCKPHSFVAFVTSSERRFPASCCCLLLAPSKTSNVCLFPLTHHLWFAAWQMVLHYIHPQPLQGNDRHWCCLPKQSKYWHWDFVARRLSSNTSRRTSVNIFTFNKILINWDYPPPPSKRLMPFVSACRWFYFINLFGFLASNESVNILLLVWLYLHNDFRLFFSS